MIPIRTLEENVISQLFSDLLIIGLLFFIIFLDARTSYSIGDGYAFVYLAVFVQLMRIYYKQFRREANAISQILLLLTLSNYVATVEASQGITTEVVIAGFMLVVLIVHLTFNIVILPFTPREVKKSEIRKRVTEIIAIRPVGLTIFYAGLSASAYLGLSSASLYKKIPILFSGVAMSWLLLALVTGLRGARAIPNDYFFYLVNRKEKLNTILVRKWFLYISAGTFVIGTSIEMALRGLLLMWIISWAVMLLILLQCWQTWKCVFSDKEVNIDELSPDVLRSAYNPRIALKLIATHFLCGIIYAVCVVLAWYHYYSR